MLGILTLRGSSLVAFIVEFMGGCNRMLSLEGCESPLLVALSLFQILLLFLLDFLGPFTISDLVTTNIFSPFLQPLSEQFELSESFFLLRHSILVLKISFLSPICLVYPVTSQTFFLKKSFPSSTLSLMFSFIWYSFPAVPIIISLNFFSLLNLRIWHILIIKHTHSVLCLSVNSRTQKSRAMVSIYSLQ